MKSRQRRVALMYVNARRGRVTSAVCIVADDGQKWTDKMTLMRRRCGRSVLAVVANELSYTVTALMRTTLKPRAINVFSDNTLERLRRSDDAVVIGLLRVLLLLLLFYDFLISYFCLQCFGTDGWASGRASGLQKIE